MELSNPWIRQGKEEGRQEGRQEGRRDEALNLVVRLLTKKLGGLRPDRLEAIGCAVAGAIECLSLEQLEALAEAVFEIGSDDDLSPWLG